MGRCARLRRLLEHRALVLGVRRHRRVELGHEIGAPPQLGVDVPHAACVRLRAAIRRLTSSTAAMTAMATICDDDPDQHPREATSATSAGRIAVASRRRAAGSKPATSSAGVQRSARSRRPALAASQPTIARGSAPPARSSRETDRAVALREALAVVAEQQRDVRMAGDRREAEQLVEPQLAAGRGEQIGPPHDVRHALGGVVDHDRQLVGDHAVAAPHDDVAARLRERLVLRAEQVVDEVGLAVHAHAQRRGAAVRHAPRALAAR